MPEYVEAKHKSVTPGETVIINQCESPVEISVGVVFREDGDYIVSVREGKITVCRSGAKMDAEPPKESGDEQTAENL